jgi:hypothetical protein
MPDAARHNPLIYDAAGQIFNIERRLVCFLPYVKRAR